MHLTWQPGDPVVQLDFTNPLNVSVQIGDVAYFSNPTPVGGTGNPTGSGQWASTTTPHLTSSQSDIIMIGEIVDIIPWNGATNSIICNMPQDLFNLYFTQIQAPVCTTTPSTTITTAGSGGGDCADHIPRTDVDAIYIGPTYISTWPFHPVTGVNLNIGSQFDPIMKWFFDNPSVNFNDMSFHAVSEQPINNGCLVSSTKPDYDPHLYNYWIEPIVLQIITKITSFNNIPGQGDFVGDINGNPIPIDPTNTSLANNALSTNSNDFIMFVSNDVVTGLPMAQAGGTGAATNVWGNTFQHVFDFIDTYFPGVTNSNMTYDQYFDAVKAYGITRPSFTPINQLTGTAPTVTVIPATVNCVGSGSFIMFSKDNKANLSSVLGYYASVTLRNDSLEKAELFNVGVDVFESSK